MEQAQSASQSTAPNIDKLAQANETIHPLDEMTIEEAHAAMPLDHQPTIAVIIPFPQYTGGLGEPSEIVESKQSSVPPFVIYHPALARLSKPAPGENESLAHKAQRKMEEEQDGTKGKNGIKAKAVGVRYFCKLLQPF